MVEKMVRKRTKNKKNVIENNDKINDSRHSWYEFWDLPLPRPIDETINVWFDPSILGEHGKNAAYVNDEMDETLLPISKLGRMGYNKSQEKEQRMIALRDLIDEKNLETVQEALKLMPTIRTEKTIIDYLSVIGRELYDETSQKIRGSKTANWGELNKNKRTKDGYLIKNFKNSYRYYTKNPEDGGLEITEAEYNKMKDNYFNNLKGE